MSERPPGTQLFISEDYVSELEEQLEEKDQIVETWKTYLGHAVDLLEIIRDQYDDFDKILEKFNEMDTPVQIIVTPEEKIKFKVNGKSKEN